MNLDAIIARGLRAVPARRNKITSNEIRRLIIDANNRDINLNIICATFQVEKPTPYFMAIECMFAEWKTYFKRGLANTRALTRVELELRINSFVLSPHHAMNYVSHAGRNILQYTRGVRVFDN